MRQKIGAKLVRKYTQETGLPVVMGFVRGGTDHRVDLLCARGPDWPCTGEVYAYWPHASGGPSGPRLCEGPGWKAPRSGLA